MAKKVTAKAKKTTTARSRANGKKAVASTRTTRKKTTKTSTKSAAKRRSSGTKSRKTAQQTPVMIRLRGTSEVALESLTDWWNAEWGRRSFRQWIREEKENIFGRSLRLVDSIQSRSAAASQHKEHAITWLAFWLLAGSVALATFAAGYSIFVLITT